MITTGTRLAAARYARTFAPHDRAMAARPSYVESFPASYPGLVERAEALLIRMAAPIHHQADLDQLRTDLRQFDADAESVMR